MHCVSFEAKTVRFLFPLGERTQYIMNQMYVVNKLYIIITVFKTTLVVIGGFLKN